MWLCVQTKDALVYGCFAIFIFLGARAIFFLLFHLYSHSLKWHDINNYNDKYTVSTNEIRT